MTTTEFAVIHPAISTDHPWRTPQNLQFAGLEVESQETTYDDLRCKYTTIYRFKPVLQIPKEIAIDRPTIKIADLASKEKP